jgi:hypothetical protein
MTDYRRFLRPIATRSYAGGGQYRLRFRFAAAAPTFNRLRFAFQKASSSIRRSLIAR